MNISENIKAFVGLNHKDRYIIPASEARSMSLYGSKGDRERYITDLLEEYSLKIKEASKQGKFSIVEKIGRPDYSGVLPEIIGHFQGAGYGVKLINKDQLPELDDDCFLVIAWKKDNEKLPNNG